MNSDTQYGSSDNRIFDLIATGFKFLFDAGERGDWGDVRSTSHATLLISSVVDQKFRAWVDEPARWLIAQMRDESKTGKSWESEIWDTSLAIRAILRSKLENHEKLIPAIQWLFSIQSNNINNTWHDEPWETGQALFAIFDLWKRRHLIERACNKRINEDDLCATIDWYCRLQDGQGMVIAPHTTAFLLIILQNAMQEFKCESHRRLFQECLSRGKRYLLDSLEMAPEGQLWTNEAWSNGYVLQSLCVVKAFSKTPEDENRIEKIISWFESTPQRDSQRGCWGGIADIEDTTIAIEALQSLAFEMARLRSVGDVLIAEEKYRKRILIALGIPSRPPKAKLIRSVEDGYIVFISERNKRILNIMLAIAAILSTVSGIIAFFEYLGLIGKIF